MIAPPGISIGFASTKTAFRGLVSPLRTDVDAPGGLVLAVDREAQSDPVTRLRLLRSSKIASSGVSGGLTSAVALDNLDVDGFPFAVSRARPRS